jgi:hypothetical protein
VQFTDNHLQGGANNLEFLVNYHGVHVGIGLIEWI